MSQRLALAGAVLADPLCLMLDEPANGLDPQSIQWLREFLRSYASQGRSVLVSSHLLSEMQLMADRIVVIAKGKLITDGTVDEFVSMSTRNDVLVRCDRPEALVELLRAEGVVAVAEGIDGLAVIGESTDRVGEAAFRAGVVVRELVSRRASLEEAFLELTSDEQGFAAGGQL
jgi:ABC-2 type transport system ATP-binding protein